ncbi:unnamed protein product [Oikopleura dioica]|uniref:Alpha/beta hydrolase fold-3 domain-containing protein n=1 Tax=Oikopleura dioica TaxID=34765 RepID=E4XG92_OIKDI|nr:unnamed protein product [Oikopleura dioica]
MIDPKGSPLLAPEKLFKTMPKAHIFAAEHDILYDDQVAFTRVAKKFGSDIKMTTWKGAFHIEQSFSKWWGGKTIMPSCDQNIGLYLDAIIKFQK